MATKNPVKEPRKLAPGTLPWHTESWSRFCDSVTGKRLAHAVLLAAPRGTGKRHFAAGAAAFLLCSAPQFPAPAPPQACGQCKQCRLLAADTHPDLALLEPEDSRVIKIEQIRKLTGFVERSPQVAQRKVVIIDSADRLNLNAANALLKTLEEPAEDVVLLLLHHAGEPLLPTIRSRCQTQRLALPGSVVALEWLRAEVADTDDAVLVNALDRARGAPLVALELLEGGQVAAGDECLESLRLFLRGERQLVEAVAPFVKLGLEPSLDLLGHWAFTAMKIALGASEEPPVSRKGTAPDGTPVKGREMLKYLAGANPADRFTVILDQVTQARRGQVYNLSPELTLNDILLSWKGLMPRRRRAQAAGMS